MFTTKLHRPTLPTQWVPRPRLSRRLDEGLALGRPLTLVSAPAGFGKSTCVSAWLSTHQQRPIAWLALDPGDDDPRRFFNYLIAALQRVGPRLGQAVAAALDAGQLPPEEELSTSLINDIQAHEQSFVLVLDDVQVLRDATILRFLERLVTHLPSPLHLMLLTREDPPLPLAKLRAANRLTELRARDLRFTQEECAQFLNQVMALGLNPAELALLEAKTEGWAVGLLLAALSLRDCESATEFITQLSGTHRFIVSYLTEQVLQHQPEEIRRFLLTTAQLDRLSGPLCDTVTGRADGQQMLEYLHQANLFLVPLDDSGEWYRYHHLFADLLRTVGVAEPTIEVAELHRRASGWYRRANLPDDALQHALAAEDYATAVDILEQRAMTLIMQGYAKTVAGWLAALPPQWSTRSPQTSLAFAWMHLLQGAYTQAAPHLARVRITVIEADEAGPEPSASATLQAEWLVMHSLMLNMRGAARESEETVRRALALVPAEEWRVLGLAHYALAGAYQLRGDRAHAAEAFALAIEQSRRAGSFVAEMLSTAGLALAAFELGDLHRAAELVTTTHARLDDVRARAPMSAVLYGVLGQVHLEWHQLEEARQYILHTQQLSALGGYNSATIACHIYLARLSQLEGDLEAAERRIQAAYKRMQNEVPGYVRQEVAAQQIELYLAQQRPAAAQVLLEEHGFIFAYRTFPPEIMGTRPLTYGAGLLFNRGLRLRLRQARTYARRADVAADLDAADSFVNRALDEGMRLLAAEALLLRAQLKECVPRRYDVKADEDYLLALRLAEPEAMIRIFVAQDATVADALARLQRAGKVTGSTSAFITRILATAARRTRATGNSAATVQLPNQRPPAAPLCEPLTTRELEVLRLLVDGLTYQEIAGRLIISLNTVRYHVKSIYGKLDVNNRTRASELARRLDLL